MSLSISSLSSFVAGTRFSRWGEGVHGLALEQPACVLSLSFYFFHFLHSFHPLCFLIVPNIWSNADANRKIKGFAFNI